MNSDYVLDGEVVLASSPLFQKYDLRILKDIKADGKKQIDYLVYTDQAQLLGIKLVNNCTAAPEEDGFPIQQIGLFEMMTGRVDDVLSRLEKILHNPQEWKQRPLQSNVIPVSLYQTLDKLGLSYWLKNSRLRMPTEYGKSRNIVWGYLPQANQKTRPVLFALDTSIAELEQALEPWVNSKVIPLELRSASSKQGLSCNNRYASKLVKTFAEASLEEYLAQYPEDLACLRECSPTLRTYQDAAGMLYNLFQKKPFRKKQNRDLMWMLLKTPFPTILYGAALLSDQTPLYRKVEGIKDLLRWDDQRNVQQKSMEEVLCRTRRVLGEGWEDDGYELFFRLCIEPFRACLNVHPEVG